MSPTLSPTMIPSKFTAKQAPKFIFTTRILLIIISITAGCVLILCIVLFTIAYRLKKTKNEIKMEENYSLDMTQSNNIAMTATNVELVNGNNNINNNTNHIYHNNELKFNRLQSHSHVSGITGITGMNGETPHENINDNNDVWGNYTTKGDTDNNIDNNIDNNNININNNTARGYDDIYDGENENNDIDSNKHKTIDEDSDNNMYEHESNNSTSSNSINPTPNGTTNGN